MNLEFVRTFQLVEFIEKGPKKVRRVDCVPTKWIRYNSIKKRYVSKFMPPPYDTDETNAILHKLVECELDAPDHWPEYTIKLVGDGQTYYEAVNKLKKLNTQEYVYSSGSKIHSKDKAAAVAKEIRARESIPNLKSILAVPTLKKNFEPCKKILQTSTEGNYCLF
ncbi:uncharacterized protein LOC117180155 isoform X2 [Belonocnema kinseyi]|nr:uncharacterized protein LOC117180155 isoform X2 [Belonocnema kinseyi]